MLFIHPSRGPLTIFPLAKPATRREQRETNSSCSPCTPPGAPLSSPSSPRVAKKNKKEPRRSWTGTRVCLCGCCCCCVFLLLLLRRRFCFCFRFFSSLADTSVHYTCLQHLHTTYYILLLTVTCRTSSKIIT